MDIALVIFLIFMAYWKNDFLLYLVAGIVTFLFAATWIDYYQDVSVIMVIFGCGLIAMAVILSLQAGGSSRGWSQFKGFYESIKGRF